MKTVSETIEVELPDKLAEVVELTVKSGFYIDESEFIREAIRNNLDSVEVNLR